jgi:predicted nucleic acid-binding protein
MIFVDSNVVVDVLQGDPKWSDWSTTALQRGVEEGPLVANAIVLAETAGKFPDVGEQLAFFGGLEITVRDIPHQAAFRAGLARREYRRRGGKERAMIADFLIAAHAATLQAILLTRDRRRFATYFPELTLLTPETDNG